MKNKNEYYQDSEIEKTITNHDHHAYKVTFDDGKTENFIARNVPHLVFCLGQEKYMRTIKSIEELAYCPTVFVLQNINSAAQQLGLPSGKKVAITS